MLDSVSVLMFEYDQCCQMLVVVLLDLYLSMCHVIVSLGAGPLQCVANDAGKGKHMNKHRHMARQLYIVKSVEALPASLTQAVALVAATQLATHLFT